MASYIGFSNQPYSPPVPSNRSRWVEGLGVIPNSSAWRLRTVSSGHTSVLHALVNEGHNPPKYVWLVERGVELVVHQSCFNLLGHELHCWTGSKTIKWVQVSDPRLYWLATTTSKLSQTCRKPVAQLLVSNLWMVLLSYTSVYSHLLSDQPALASDYSGMRTNDLTKYSVHVSGFEPSPQLVQRIKPLLLLIENLQSQYLPLYTP